MAFILANIFFSLAFEYFPFVFLPAIASLIKYNTCFWDPWEKAIFGPL